MAYYHWCLRFSKLIFFFHFVFISIFISNNYNFPHRFFFQLPPVCTDHRSLFRFLILGYTIYFTTLYYTVLHCTLLYHTTLYYTILYYPILYYTILYFTKSKQFYYPRTEDSLQPTDMIDFSKFIRNF